MIEVEKILLAYIDDKTDFVFEFDGDIIWLIRRDGFGVDTAFKINYETSSAVGTRSNKWYRIANDMCNGT